MLRSTNLNPENAIVVAFVVVPVIFRALDAHMITTTTTTAA
jgi:hypothetical protein